MSECLLQEKQKLNNREEVEGSKKLLVAKKGSNSRVITVRSLDTPRRTVGSLPKHSQVRRVESTRIRHVNPKGGSSSPMMPC